MMAMRLSHAKRPVRGHALTTMDVDADFFLSSRFLANDNAESGSSRWWVI